MASEFVGLNHLHSVELSVLLAHGLHHRGERAFAELFGKIVIGIEAGLRWARGSVSEDISYTENVE